MDTCASSHMTSGTYNLSSYYTLCSKHSSIFRNGNVIPNHSCGQFTIKPPHPPFTLKIFLHVHNIMKNLISICTFFNDNWVSVEVDPLGFSVKYLHRGNPLMRCESRRELYLLTTTTKVSNHFAFVVITPTIWYDQLGHPGASVFQFLRTNKDIQCNALSNKYLCSSCQFGKNLNYFLLNLICALIP